MLLLLVLLSSAGFLLQQNAQDLLQLASRHVCCARKRRLHTGEGTRALLLRLLLLLRR
jgi:hypothetical protein